MPKELEKYLYWRFIFNNHKKYHHYFNEWLSNLTETQLYYFAEEMRRCRNARIYKF